MSQEMWDVVEQKLSYHRKAKDRTGLDALNRVFAEKVLPRCGEIGEPPRLGPETCSIRRNEWTLNQLEESLIRTHKRVRPQNEKPPLIAVEYRGKVFVVDGTTRANKWIAEKRPGPHPILLIMPRTG